MRDVVWQIVHCDEHMIQNDEGKYDWQIDEVVINSGKVQVPSDYDDRKVHEMLENYTGFEGDHSWRINKDKQDNEHHCLVSEGPNREFPWDWTELRWTYKEESKHG